MANFSVSLKNMEINLFGFKLRLDVIILLIVSYFLLWGHVICSCSKGSVKEAFEKMEKEKEEQKNKYMQSNVINGPEEAQNALSTTKEGFVGANINYGESSSYDITDKPINTKNWFEPDLTYKKGSKGDGVKNILNRKEQPIPLPEGEMLMFANTEFKPECCPNAYSNSMGCACMTVDQYNYLISRGSNNVPYSEY